MSKIKIARGLTATALLLTIALPSLASVNDVDRANASIAVAKSKIQTGDSLGATDQAADVQARARVALETAKLEQNKHNDVQAYHAAANATALAEFAIASAELKTLATQRDQLAAR